MILVAALHEVLFKGINFMAQEIFIYKFRLHAWKIVQHDFM